MINFEVIFEISDPNNIEDWDTSCSVKTFQICPPFRGQRGNYTASRRSRSNFEFIFEINYPSYHAQYTYFNFGLHFEAKKAIIRPHGGQGAILRLFLRSITQVILELIDIHHALYTYFNFGLHFEAKKAIIRPHQGQGAGAGDQCPKTPRNL